MKVFRGEDILRFVASRNSYGNGQECGCKSWHNGNLFWSNEISVVPSCWIAELYLKIGLGCAWARRAPSGRATARSREPLYCHEEKPPSTTIVCPVT